MNLVWVVGIIIASAVIAIILLVIFMRRNSSLPTLPRSETLPAEEYSLWQSDSAPPRTRRHLQDQVVNDQQKPNKLISNWSCQVCGFENVAKATSCSLCDTTTNSRYDFLRSKLTALQRAARKRKDWLFRYQDDSLATPPVWTQSSKYNPSVEEVSGTELVYFQSNDSLTTPTQQKKHTHSNAIDQKEPMKTKKKSLTNFFISLLEETATGQQKQSYDTKILEEMQSKTFSQKYRWFLAELDKLSNNNLSETIKIKLNRANLLNESVHVLNSISLSHLHAKMKIEYQHEIGIDVGGLTRDWYTQVSRLFFTKESNLFQAIVHKEEPSNCTFFILPTFNSGDDKSEVYQGVGRFFGRALFDSQVLGGGVLCIPLLKHLLGVPITFSDLEYLDDEIYRGLVVLSRMKDPEEIKSLQLDFTWLEFDCTSKKYTPVDLIPNGTEIDVTLENKWQYLEVIFKYLVYDRVAPQLHALQKGFYEVISRELIQIFDYKEFEFLICGHKNIDVEDWFTHTVVSDNLINSSTLTWFWEILQTKSQPELGNFLRYATGSSRLPIQGFKGLTSSEGKLALFSLNGVDLKQSDSLDGNIYDNEIRAHSCFNRIDLPLYQSKVQLELVMDVLCQEEFAGFTIE